MRRQDKTVLELLHYAGKLDASRKDAQVVGDTAASIWRTVLPDDPPAKVDQVEGDEVYQVNIYPREFWPVVLNVILQYYLEKEQHTCKPFEGLRKHLNDRKGKRPRIKRYDSQPVNIGQ